jgi:hypothetical protein
MNKAHILQEIKRTAEANGGVPLGKVKFESETGIKETDWFGKFWARWGEAVREAGFTPNQLTIAYDKNELLEKYANLSRELGRLPTGADLRLKTRRDSNFPSNSTFENRFSTKLELVQQLELFCKTRNQYGDIALLSATYISQNQGNPDKVKIEKEQIGFVYLIKSGRFYKIGRANSAGRREYEIALQLPEKTSTVHVIKTDDPNGIEAYWHNRFISKRKNGEWFDLSAADVAIFKRRKFM